MLPCVLPVGTIPAGIVKEDQYFIEVRESQPVFFTLAGITGIVLGGLFITGGLVTGILVLNSKGY